ncbi:hypothetical protein ACJX0J_010080, partial [Zea mays]
RGKTVDLYGQDLIILVQHFLEEAFMVPLKKNKNKAWLVRKSHGGRKDKLFLSIVSRTIWNFQTNILFLVYMYSCFVLGLHVFFIIKRIRKQNMTHEKLLGLVVVA